MLRLRRWRAVVNAALLAAALAATLPRSAALEPGCGALDTAFLATGRGLADDAPALAAMDGDASTGLIYLRATSRHLIASNLTLGKPLVGEAGARLLVASNATLVVQAQPEHPLVHLFDVAGGRGRQAGGGEERACVGAALPACTRAAACVRRVLAGPQAPNRSRA